MIIAGTVRLEAKNFLKTTFYIQQSKMRRQNVHATVRSFRGRTTNNFQAKPLKKL